MGLEEKGKKANSRRATEIINTVRSDRPLHFRPCQALEVGFWAVYDFEVPGGDVGEEGGA